jgi:hypothetical protein
MPRCLTASGVCSGAWEQDEPWQSLTSKVGNVSSSALDSLHASLVSATCDAAERHALATEVGVEVGSACRQVDAAQRNAHGDTSACRATLDKECRGKQWPLTSVPKVRLRQV